MLPCARFFFSYFSCAWTPFFLNWTIYYYQLSFSSFQFSVLRPDHFPQTDLQSRSPHQTNTPQQSTRSAPDQTTKSEYQTRPSSDPTTIRPSDRHHHTRPPDQIIPTDKHPWLVGFKSAQQHKSLWMVQVRCIPCGLGQGGYIELWMNLAKHTFHTLSAWSFRTLFRLNLTVVRLASGAPRAGKGLPCPFS